MRQLEERSSTLHMSLRHKAYGGAAMLTDHDLRQMYELAHCLHPDQGIALAVTLAACERLTLLRRLQDRRTGRYRLSLPEAGLPQYCVYLASDPRERAQERPPAGPAPVPVGNPLWVGVRPLRVGAHPCPDRSHVRRVAAANS